MFRLILLSILMFYLQFLYAPAIGLFQTVPNLLLPVVLYFCIIREGIKGLVLAFLLGLALDLNLPSSFGVSALLFVIIAYTTGNLKKYMNRQQMGMMVLLIFLANVFYFFGASLIFSIFNTGNELPAGKIILLSFYNTIYSFVLMLLLYLLDHLNIRISQK
ncbi:MAG TPA: rod shape-determining protein MreD [Candidatus Cloacimonetes bacterium]|nr:rod shape-determining protein MreD [Candidatus Cloacimonadota bacterium]